VRPAAASTVGAISGRVHVWLRSPKWTRFRRISFGEPGPREPGLRVVRLVELEWVSAQAQPIDLAIEEPDIEEVVGRIYNRESSEAT